MILNNIHIENFMSIGNVDIELDKQGLVLVLGNNLDSPCSSSNFSGKSNFFNAILQALYGKNWKQVRGKNIIRDGEKYCKLSIRVNNDYVIERTYDVNDKNHLKINGKESNQEDVDSLIGMGWNGFINFCFYGDDTNKKELLFAESTNTNRFEVLKPFLHDELWDSAKVRAEDKLKLINRDCLNAIKERDKVDIRIETYEKQLVDHVENVEHQKQIYEELVSNAERNKITKRETIDKHLFNIEQSKRDIIGLSNKIVAINKDKADYEAGSDIPFKIKGFENQINEYKQMIVDVNGIKGFQNTKKRELEIVIDNIQFELNNYCSSESGYALKIKEHQHKIDDLIEEIKNQRIYYSDNKKKLIEEEEFSKVLLTKRAKFEHEIENYQSLIAKEICPTCEQTVNPDNYKDKIERLNKQLFQMIENYEVTTKSIELRNNELLEIQKQGESLKLQINSIQKDIDQINKEKQSVIDSYKDKIYSCEKEIEGLNKDKQNQIDSYKDKIKLLQSDIDKLNHEKQNNLKEYDQQIEKYKKEISNLENQMESTQELIAGIEREIKGLDNNIVNQGRYVDNAISKKEQCVKDIEQMKTEKKEIEEKIESLDTGMKYGNACIKVYGPQGCKNTDLRKLIPFINNHLSYFNNRIFSGMDYHIELSASRELKDGNLKNEIDIVMADDYNRKSRSERKRIDILFNLALSQLHPHKSNVIFADELLSSLDSKGTEIIISMFREMISEGMISSVFLVSFKDYDLFDNKIIFTRENGITKI